KPPAGDVLRVRAEPTADDEGPAPAPVQRFPLGPRGEQPVRRAAAVPGHDPGALLRRRVKRLEPPGRVPRRQRPPPQPAALPAGPGSRHGPLPRAHGGPGPAGRISATWTTVAARPRRDIIAACASSVPPKIALRACRGWPTTLVT